MESLSIVYIPGFVVVSEVPAKHLQVWAEFVLGKW